MLELVADEGVTPAEVLVIINRVRERLLLFIGFNISLQQLRRQQTDTGAEQRRTRPVPKRGPQKRLKMN